MPTHDDAIDRLASEIRAMREELTQNCADTRIIKVELLGDLGDDRPGLRTRVERIEHRVKAVERVNNRAFGWLLTAIGSGLAAVASAVWAWFLNHGGPKT